MDFGFFSFGEVYLLDFNFFVGVSLSVSMWRFFIMYFQIYSLSLFSSEHSVKTEEEICQFSLAMINDLFGKKLSGGA